MANNLTPKEEFLLNPVTEHNITDAAIATFETNLRHGVKVEVPFEPVQDLHGMSNPYPAGESVNLIPDTTDAENGYVAGYHLNSDGSTTANADWYISEYIELDSATTYTWSNRVNINIAPSICFYDENKTFISGIAINNQYSNTFTPPEGAVYARSSQTKYAFQEASSTNGAFQLEIGSTATPYKRYSNICQISGWTGCEIYISGINLADYSTFIENYRLDNNGNISSNSNYATSQFIRVKPGSTYRFINLITSSYGYALCEYDRNKNFLEYTNFGTGGGPVSGTKTLRTDTYFIRVSCWKYSIPHVYPGVNYPYTNNNYVASKGIRSLPINWESEAGTIYGGTVTLNEDGSADLVSNWVKREIPSFSNITYYGSNRFMLRNWANGGYDKAGGPRNLICDVAQVKWANENYTVYGQDGSSSIFFRDNTISTVEEFKSKYAGYYICYELFRGRQSYHFPNVGKLKAFLGTNNIWSDIGNVNVKYLTQNSETGMEYRGDRALELRRRAMIADSPTIHTTTGSEETGGLASFKSYVKAPVKKIEIPFKSKQDLHGYDHPWPAGGWKNIFNKDGAFVDNVVIKSETAYKLASGTGSAISTVMPGKAILLNETIDGVTKLKPWIYLGLDESGNARLYREKADDEPRQMDATTSSVSYDGCDMDQYLVDETTGFLSRFDSATLAALVATSIKYVDYFATGDNTASVQTISRKCFLPSYSEMGYGDDPAGNEGQSYLAALKTYYENNTDNTVRIGKTEERLPYRIWLRSGYDVSWCRHRTVQATGTIGYDSINATNTYVRPMISLDPNTVVETVDFGKDTIVTNTSLYTDSIAVSPSTTYVLSGRCYTNQVMRVDEYDTNDNFLRSTVSTAMNHPSITFTTTEDTAYVLVNPDWVIRFIQLEAGTEATSYAPYSNICPIEGYSDGVTYFEAQKANIYGARWNRLQHSLTRYGAAEDFDTDVTNFRINGEVSSSYDNPFDDLYPWSERKLCNINLAQYMALQNGSSITDCVTYWEGETGFSYDDPDGVWVYTPKFWGRSYDDSNGHRCFEVSDRPVHDFIEYEEQITARWRGVVEERTINGESKQILLPILGNPGRYIPVNTLHTYAKNYGGSITSIYSIDPSYLLMIVEFASMNPRLDVGGGVNSLYRQNAADKFVENATDSTVVKLQNTYAAGMIPDALIDIGTASGGNQIGSRWIVSAILDESTNIWTVTLNEPVTVTTANFWSIHGMANRPDAAIGSKSGYLGENNRSHAYYRGEELWGNFWIYVIGAYKSARDEVWLCPKTLDPDDYNALNESVHINTGVQLATSSGWNREFGYPEKSYGLSAPAFNVLVGGNATDPIGSYYYTAARGARIPLVGGDASDGPDVGFYWDWYCTSSSSYWYSGASPRLKNPPRGLSGGPQSP